MKSSKKTNITEEILEKYTSSWKYKFTRWFQYTWVGERYYNIKNGIPALWRWRKIAWNDRDWDFRYIYDAMHFKLENTANLIEETQRHMDYKRDVFWLRTCAGLINKVREEFYVMERYDWLDVKMNFGEADERGMSEMTFETKRDELDEYFAKYPTWKKRAIQHIKDNKERYTTDENDRQFVASRMGYLRHEKARKLLFNIMCDKIEGWWE